MSNHKRSKTYLWKLLFTIILSTLSLGCTFNNEPGYQCQGDGLQPCIDSYVLCNGDLNCPLGDDESNCENTDPSTCIQYDGSFGYKCQDQTCIKHRYVCDGKRDCYDGDDESNCTKHSACKTWDGKTGHQCEFENRRFKICILNEQICDGHTDCPDSFDEKNCESILTSSCKTHDNEHGYRCQGHGQQSCIYRMKICDGVKDCPSGDDETNCSSPVGCKIWNGDTGFMCKNIFNRNQSQCISRRFLCDGNLDCENGADEKNCDLEMKSACTTANGGFGYRCQGTGDLPCIKRRSICDWIKDCPLGDDEENCWNIESEQVSDSGPLLVAKNCIGVTIPFMLFVHYILLPTYSV